MIRVRLAAVATALLCAAVLCSPALASPHRDAPSSWKAPAAASATANLRVGSLSRSARSVEAGRSLVVRGRVRNTARRAVRPTVSLSLASPAAGRIGLGSATVGRLGARRSTRFAVTVRVPAAIGAGRYTLRACARHAGRGTSRCTNAPVRLRVTAPPATPAPGPAPSPPAEPAPPVSTPTPAPGPAFADGARSAGDSLFPTIGNGGYDALGYRLDLAYDPGSAVLDGTATMTATATQDLASYSLDLQGLEVTAVTVDGAPAFFAREGTKLIVTPTAGIPAGATFATAVDYGGAMQPIQDPDGSFEGWFPTDTGAIVVCQPIGAQGWFPSNNTPTDKATFEVAMTVPLGLEVLGNGELQSRVAGADTETFTWREANPMATFLTTASIGEYELGGDVSPGGVPNVWGIDRAANTSPQGAAIAPLTDAQLQTARERMALNGPVVDLLASRLGPYPNASTGGIVANAPYIGYALEVNSRPVYTGGGTSVGTLVHEQVHQWLGNAVSGADWRDIYLAEAFASWFPSWYAHATGATTTTPAQQWGGLYATATERTTGGALRPVWRPMVVQDPVNLFGESTYTRGGMWVEALRQRIGEPALFAVLRNWARENRYGTGSSATFQALVERDTGEDLDALFDDWLYTTGKPTVGAPSAAYAG